MKVERDGLGYRAAIVSEGISIAVERLTESRGETYGELSVARVPEGHVMRSRLSLTSSGARSGAAGYLARRAGGPDWTAILEDFCVAVLAREREGSPVVKVGKLPPRKSVEFLLDPMLPIGKPTILYGEEGTGKSTLASAIAVAVTTATPTFSRWSVPRQRGVLVLDWEGDGDDWNDLIAACSAGIGIEAPDVLYQACAGPLTSDIHKVARTIAEHDVGLLIVDSVGMASPNARDGSDASEGAMRLFAGLRALGTTSLLIDHVNKSDNEGRASRPYGSVYKPALARATYELRAAEDSDEDGTRHLALFHRKGNQTRRQAPVGIAVHRTESEILLRWEPVMLADAKLAKGATLTDRIRDLLSDGALTVDEIADGTESSAAVIRKVLNRHSDSLFVAVTKSGEKAKRWGLRASVTVSRDMSHRASVTGAPPKGGEPPVSHMARAQRNAFGELADMNAERRVVS